MKTKLIFSLLFLVAFITTLMHLQTVHAEEKQTIIVSSLKFEDTKDLQIQSSPGKPISALTKFTGINNKKFQLYDVTDLFVSFRQANSAINDSTLDTKFIASLTKDQLATHSFISNTTQTTTYGDGTMVFNVIKEDEQGYHVYLLKEIGNGDISSPMLIRLPVIDQGNELNPIYLYTKNVIKVDPVFKPELIKTINDKKDSYTFGDDIVYSVDFTIPSTVEQAKSVELLDTYDRGLQKKSLTKLSIDGQLVPNDLYTERVSDQHTSYSFKPSSLTKYIGKTLTLEYTLQLINSTVEKTQYNNTIKLMISEKEILRDHETISTGGKHFKKIDLATKKPLADASFYLTNETGQILALDNQGYHWQSEIAQAHFLTSNQNGDFKINGLAYGNYALNEIKPPKGYVINQEPIPFEIAKGTFEQSPIQALEIVNKASTKDTTTSSDKMIPIEQSASPRNPNNSLSSEILGITPTTLKKYVATGEKISTWITILGLLLLFTIALIWKKRSGIK